MKDHDFEWRHIRSDGKIFWLRGDSVWLREQMRPVWDLLNSLIETDEEEGKKEAATGQGREASSK